MLGGELASMLLATLSAGCTANCLAR